jgi:cation-transporting ATPase 13A3/4/5
VNNDIIEEVSSEQENDETFMESHEKINQSQMNKKNLISISKLLKKNETFRKNISKNIPIEELVPGDLVLIQADTKVPCDILLVRGSCLVNEAVLTGESVPITKTFISNGEELTSVNVLYAGSDCLLQRDDVVVGLVVNTGWNTFKGKIISSLVNNKMSQSEFVHQIIYVCKWLIVIFAFITIYMIINDIIKDQFETIRTLRYSTDLMANGCQPTTLFMLSISVVLVAYKLEKRGVQVMHPKKLFQAGRVDTICFDKTGTLTQNELKVFGVTLNDSNDFTKVYPEIKSMISEENQMEIKPKDDVGSADNIMKSSSKKNEEKNWLNFALKMSRILGCCQDLHILNGKLVGDPVDIEMFKVSGCELETKEFNEGTFVGDYMQKFKTISVIRPIPELTKTMNKSEDYGFLILNIFPFSSDKKRMGAIVMDSNQISFPENENSVNESSQSGNEESEKYFYVCKGAPEKILEICVKESVPDNYSNTLDEYAQKGIRVIAFASRPLTSPNLRQEDAEKNLIFGGFLLLSNPLKPSTKSTIQKLQFNHVGCNMITGDHVFTGINVGYASGILKETENVWVGQFNPEQRKVDWKFFTFEDLKKNIHSVKENKDVDLTSNIFDESRQTSIRKIPKSESSTHSLQMIGNLKSQLAAYSKIVSTRQKTDIKRLLLESSDVDFKIALDGNAMQYLFKKYNETSPENVFILQNTKIFGRCKPDQKRLIIERLKDLKIRKHRCVAFVGDGANDCKALNHADIGLSIGNNEASMASPFITSNEDIETVCDTLELGRYSIENFVHIYLCMNGLGVMDVGALCILLYSGYYYSNFKYMLEYWYYGPMALIITMTDSVGSLKKILPQALMFNKRVNFFLLGISLVIFLALIICYWIYSSRMTFKFYEDTYTSNTIDMEENFVEDHALLLIFYTFCVIAYSSAVQVGYPFKKSLYTNVFYIILGCILVIVSTLFTNPSAFTSNFDINYFSVHYLRSVEYQGNFFWLWLFFCVISCFSIFLVGRYIFQYFLVRKIKKIERIENSILGEKGTVFEDKSSSKHSIFGKRTMNHSHLSKQSKKSFEKKEGFSSRIHYEGQSAHEIY